MTLLCAGCDAIRDVERAYCASCGESTDSYPYTPERNDEGQVWVTRGAGDYTAVIRTSFTPEAIHNRMRSGASQVYFDKRDRMGRAAA